MSRLAVDYKNAYLPKGWDTEWQSAKTNLASTPAWITFFGDSVTVGANTSDWNVNPFAQLIRTNLLNTYSKYADFYPTTYSAAWATSVSETFNGTPPWVVNKTSGLVWNTHAWNKLPGYNASSVVAEMTFTTPYACTSLDILYMDYTSGTWTYTVDAGSPVTVTTIKGGTGSDAVIKRISLTGLANTTHTIVLGNSSGANVGLYLGIVTYAGSTGIGFANFGYGAGSLNDYSGSTTWPNEDRVTFFSGVNPQSLPFGNTYTFSIPTQPQLAIIAFGINDCVSSVSTVTFSSILGRYITALRLGNPNASILLLGNCMPNTAHSDVISGVSNGINFPNYTAVMLTQAQANNCAFVNINERWGQTPAGQQFMKRNDVHPTNVGHVDIANLINTII